MTSEYPAAVQDSVQRSMQRSMQTTEERMVTLCEDIMQVLTRMEQRITVLEQFVTDARTAIEAMPPMPFVPRFKFRGKNAGGT